MYNNSLYIASDHGGYQLKRRLLRFFQNELNIEIEDVGSFEYNPTDDYPKYVISLAEKVIKTNGRGIVICRNGIGVNMVANKIKGIRCGIGYNIAVAESMMTDDNTNVLSLAAEHVTEEHAMAIVRKWLETDFSHATRHKRRLKEVAKLDAKIEN